MAIPGYDPEDVEQALLERETGDVDGNVSVVAAVVPEEFGLERRPAEAPSGALSDPVELTGVDGLEGLDVLQVELAYDPTELPPGASPTEVAVAVETDAGWESLNSDVDLEDATVTATTTERPAGTTLVAIHDQTASSANERSTVE